MNMEKEFTGDYEKCDACGYVWDFIETHCPECGSQEIVAVSANEVRRHYENVKGREHERMEKMLELHGD